MPILWIASQMRSHEDQCGWHYEIKKGQHEWTGHTHKHLLERARNIINKAKELNITTETAIAILDVNK